VGEALVGVVVGAVLGVFTTVGIETWREGRRGRAAARLIQLEIIEAQMVGKSSPGPYPFPLKDVAWIAFRDRLAGISDWDLIEVTHFYMQNQLVERGIVEPRSGADIEKRAIKASEALGRYRHPKPKRLWRRLWPSPK
jgi:hypothetical protein